MDSKRVARRVKDALRAVARGGALSIREDDTFITSYPKSGNTWLRFLLGALLLRRAGSGEVDFHNLDRLIPDIYRHRERELRALPGPRFLKSHDPYDPRVRRAVYMVRDPRSVATSYYFYLQRERRLSPDEPVAAYLPRFLRGELDPYGTWDAHVEGWLAAERDNPGVVVLGYEEMRVDPLPGARRAAQALGLPDDETSLAAAVEASSFERMQRLDRGRTSTADPGLKGKNLEILFVRKGKPDEWREHLDRGCLDQLQDAFGGTMERLGYRLV